MVPGCYFNYGLSSGALYRHLPQTQSKSLIKATMPQAYTQQSQQPPPPRSPACCCSSSPHPRCPPSRGGGPAAHGSTTGRARRCRSSNDDDCFPCCCCGCCFESCSRLDMLTTLTLRGSSLTSSAARASGDELERAGIGRCGRYPAEVPAARDMMSEPASSSIMNKWLVVVQVTSGGWTLRKITKKQNIWLPVRTCYLGCSMLFIIAAHPVSISPEAGGERSLTTASFWRPRGAITTRQINLTPLV